MKNFIRKIFPEKLTLKDDFYETTGDLYDRMFASFKSDDFAFYYDYAKRIRGNILDLAAVPAIQKETYLPVIVDPSHDTGRRDLIFNMSCAAIAAGASGLMVEMHYNPAEALVDAQQAITPDELGKVIKACQEIHKLVKPAVRNEKNQGQSKQ